MRTHDAFTSKNIANFIGIRFFRKFEIFLINFLKYISKCCRKVFKNGKNRLLLKPLNIADNFSTKSKMIEFHEANLYLCELHQVEFF